jgi:competence protein ComEC
MFLYIGGVALTTLIAGSVTAPFAIYHFNRFAAFGLDANLLAVPVTALWIMPSAVAAFLLMPFGLEAVALTPWAGAPGW